MLQYPSKLNFVFEKLLKFEIRPVIVGGYVRDTLLGTTSKDIDIELYGIHSYDRLEILLEEFGNVNIVGKSFGICKLQLPDIEVDFSFPRLDSKVSKGHKGFDITIDVDLDFKTATSRRDFTLNSIGYDIASQKILDPFNGIKDLNAGVLQAVDLAKFAEDPLRIMRAVQLSARFDFKLDHALFNLLLEMIQTKSLQELPSERIFEELKKVLFKAKKPSKSLLLLQKLGTIKEFPEFTTLLEDFDFIAHQELTHKQLSKTLTALIHIINGDTTQSEVLSSISKELQKITPLLQGRDLINLGLKPSKEFGHILDKIYLKQIQGEVTSKAEAILLVKKVL